MTVVYVESEADDPVKLSPDSTVRIVAKIPVL